MATPFVKWAGGKSKLAPLIEDRIENSIGFENIEHYIEAFTGGGALFFHLIKRHKFKSITLIDINIELINAYKAIQENPVQLMDFLQQMENEYNSISEVEQSDYFYEIRSLFNQIDDKYMMHNEILYERAAQFIFLNKTCFNGLYRENKKGKYNVPFGKRKKVALFEPENILEINAVLQDVNLVQGDYTKTKDYLKENTLVYFDPPYRPITGTAAFTTYSKDGFNDDDQVELSNLCKEIDSSGAYFTLSNSDPYNGSNDELDNFFDGLYKGFEFFRITASRAIAAKATSRNSISEILVLNEPKFDEKDSESYIQSRGTEMLTYEQFNQLDKDTQFKHLMDTLSLTNRTPQYYVNWDKVGKNVKSLEISLNTLNYLIGKENIYEETFELFTEQPKLISAIPTLLAIRDSKFKVLRLDKELQLSYDNLDFKQIDTTQIDKYVKFAQETGLLDFLAKKATKSLVDYVFGVEVGLDSNGRKNRSGIFMEEMVEKKIQSICIEHDLEYIPQANAVQVQKQWGFVLPYKESMRNHDFAIFNRKTNKLVIIEVNYYGGGGSKLKSVSGEFAELSAYLKEQNAEIQFVWITDGQGWHTANRPLRDAFEVIDYIINLEMLNKGYLDEILLI